ncbi:MAG: ribonuclease E/G [Gaiellaceae bacterium]
MRWFRLGRKAQVEHAPVEAAAPVELPNPVTVEAAPAAAETDQSSKPKRRRGSRGGRGRARAKPGEPAATAKPRDEKDKEKKDRKPERKPAQQSQRRERAQSQRRRREPPKPRPLPAAKRELLISVDVGEQRVAVVEDDKVAEVYLERPERRSIAGNIYLGTVDNVLPGMEAAFIEIGLEKNGFLYVDEIVAPELEGKRHGRKIQDLISRGQTIMVQAVKDPMKTKGARLTTEISLPGRFVVFVPNGEGQGVSRRLEDDERQRLKDIMKRIAPKDGGVIVRTAAEGASAEDIERDLVFLQKLWKSIQQRAKEAAAPSLVYQEAELPLRVTRDLFTDDFVRAYVDNDRTYKRVTGYLKKTSPHMVERVVRFKEKTPLLEHFGVEAEIRSTLSRRVDLPSGGYLVFDYAEAFTVIDVNTGRFVGSRSKSSGARLEDTITKNNLEAVKEVVRQLRLRDIGGIIVIDFIDMANPKNRATVEEALRRELERDRTKTYVVEISPLGLVEMTRQNVTDGPREVMTKKCPRCGGDGIVVSEGTAALDIERRLRALATGSRAQAYRVEVAAKVASLVVGPGAERLVELEAQTRRRFYLVGKDEVHLDHFLVLAEGKREDLAPQLPVEEGAEIELKLGEVGLHDPQAGVGKLDGTDICVANAAKLVGKKVNVRIERALDGTMYATVVGADAHADLPITAEQEAEKPTRRPATKKPAVAPEEPPAEDAAGAEAAADDEADPEGEAAADTTDGAAAKKKTRRGSRGGRGRKKKPATAAAASANGAGDADTVADAAAEPVAKIHVPDRELGEETTAADETDAPSADGSDEPKPKKKTRRGSRGGRNRRKKPVGAAAEGGGTEATSDNGDAPAAPDAPAAAPTSETPDAASTDDREWGYVPMSEWGDEIGSGE